MYNELLLVEAYVEQETSYLWPACQRLGRASLVLSSKAAVEMMSSGRISMGGGPGGGSEVK